MSPTRLALLLAALALLGAVSPVTAGGHGSPVPAAAETPTDQATAQNDTNVSVTPGAQLSTVLTATEVSTRGEIETTRFEVELERGDEAERAETIAERADALAERAATIREAYEEAAAAHEAGELSTQEYARRLAALNARAEQLLAEVETLRSHARNVSSLELHAAGLNRSALRDAVEALEPLSGVGPTALLERFLGEASGEIELRSADGLRVEVEGDDGERSLEVNRPRDDDPSLTVTQDSALRTARSTLPPGNWTLETASVHPDSGYYKFEFERRSTNESGEAEVRVDGSSGEVFRLEVEIEPRDDDRDEDEAGENEADDHHDDDREVTLLVVDGQPAPNGTITVRAMADGEPAANVTVSVNGHAVAETDAHGEATLQLPRASEVEVVAGEGELEFEFDEAADEERALFRQLAANTTLHDGRVTVDIAFDGSPVEGVTVYANDEQVGETGTDGTVTFAFDANASDELELDLVKGAFEAEFEYEVRGSELVLTDSSHDGDAGDDEREETDEGGEDDEGEDEDRDDEADEDEEEDEEDDSSGPGSGDEEATETADDDG